MDSLINEPELMEWTGYKRRDALAQADAACGVFDNMRQTIFSPCRTYRYALWREWIGGEGYVMFVGLNPSTADETQDDPTIRRCIAFAKAWGANGTHKGRDAEVRAMLDQPLTKAGHPGHPLYLRKTLTPVPMGSNVEVRGGGGMADFDAQRIAKSARGA